MKITIEFENEDEALTAINGWKYREIIKEVDNSLREQQKYEEIEKIQIEEARRIINQFAEQYEVRIWE